MGFFKKIFKKKKGGTMFGNLLRGVSSAATGGILGSGASLAKWEMEQAEKEQNALVEQQMKQVKAFQVGQTLGKPLEPHFQKAVNSPQANELKKTAMLDYVKKHWWKFLIPAVLIIGGIVYFSRRGNRKGKKGIV